MNKITSLNQANDYLNDIAVYLWQKENIIHCVTWQSEGPVIKLRYPEPYVCKSMSEAAVRVQYFADRHRASDKVYKTLTEEQQQTVRDFWEKERQGYKDFNAVVQGWYPPHK